MDSDFFDLAGQVIASPYFYERGDADFLQQRKQEKYALVDTVSQCKTYDDLQGEMKELFDRAYIAIEHQQNDDDTWGERIWGSEPLDSVISPEARALMTPSADHSNLLVLAMIEATQKGDHETVEKLAELAKEPGLLASILDGDYDEDKEEKKTKINPSMPKIKPSPFAKRKFLSKAIKGNLLIVRDVCRQLKASTSNLIPLARLRPLLAAEGMSRSEQDAAIHELRSMMILSGIGPEGRHGITQETRDSMIQEGQNGIAFLAFR